MQALRAPETVGKIGVGPSRADGLHIPKNTLLASTYDFDRRKQRLSVQEIKGFLATAIAQSNRSDDPLVAVLVDDLEAALAQAKKKRVEMATGMVDAAFSEFWTSQHV